MKLYYVSTFLNNFYIKVLSLNYLYNLMKNIIVILVFIGAFKTSCYTDDFYVSCWKNVQIKLIILQRLPLCMNPCFNFGESVEISISSNKRNFVKICFGILAFQMFVIDVSKACMNIFSNKFNFKTVRNFGTKNFFVTY